MIPDIDAIRVVEVVNPCGVSIQAVIRRKTETRVEGVAVDKLARIDAA